MTPSAPADPPTTASDALAQYRQVAGQAEQVNEQKLQAQDDFNAKQAELKGLSGAAFDGQALNEQQAKAWIAQAQSLLNQAHALAAG